MVIMIRALKCFQIIDFLDNDNSIVIPGIPASVANINVERNSATSGIEMGDVGLRSVSISDSTNRNSWSSNMGASLEEDRIGLILANGKKSSTNRSSDHYDPISRHWQARWKARESEVCQRHHLWFEYDQFIQEEQGGQWCPVCQLRIGDEYDIELDGHYAWSTSTFPTRLGIDVQ